jgi:hypothetical protein
MSVDNITAFQGEVMLLQWAESNTRGRTVTFLLQEDGDSHPFRDFTVKSGKKAGQRFAMVLVQIDDNEEPVERTPSQLAYLLCRDEQFWGWAQKWSLDDICSEESARAFILNACKVDSRSKLDTNLTARSTWEAVIWGPFTRWRAEQTEVRLD